VGIRCSQPGSIWRNGADTHQVINMRKPRLQGIVLLVLCAVAGKDALAECSVSWNQLVSTESEQTGCVRDYGSDVPHFTRSWLTAGSWNGSEGYMRWRVTRTMGEDDDGYWINFPQTTARPIFISFIGRVGPSWWSSHYSGGRFKFVIFQNRAGTNPRPTIFSMPIYSERGNIGSYTYRTFGPDLEAGGQGCDEFGNCEYNQSYAYPNHRYKEDRNGQDQWYFVVMSLEQDRTKTYIWSQDGELSGLYAQSQLASSSMVSSWNANTWSTVRLLAYIEATTAGNESAFMDIGHIRVTQTLPSPPEGFVTGAVKPRPPGGVIVE